MIELPGVPHVTEINVLVPVEDGRDVLTINYCPYFHAGVTFVGRIRACLEGVKAFPFVWGTFGVDSERMKILGDDKEAIDWLVEQAKEQQQNHMAAAAAADLQGGVDA